MLFSPIHKAHTVGIEKLVAMASYSFVSIYNWQRVLTFKWNKLINDRRYDHNKNLERGDLIT